jgi:hypothetical protein
MDSSEQYSKSSLSNSETTVGLLLDPSIMSHILRSYGTFYESKQMMTSLCKSTTNSWTSHIDEINFSSEDEKVEAIFRQLKRISMSQIGTKKFTFRVDMELLNSEAVTHMFPDCSRMLIDLTSISGRSNLIKLNEMLYHIAPRNIEKLII